MSTEKKPPNRPVILAIRILVGCFGLLLIFTLLYAWLGFTFLPKTVFDLLSKVVAILALPAVLMAMLLPQSQRKILVPPGTDDRKSLINRRKAIIIGGVMIGTGVIVVPVAGSLIGAYFSWNALNLVSWIGLALIMPGIFLIVNSLMREREN